MKVPSRQPVSSRASSVAATLLRPRHATQAVQQAKEGLLISSIVQRFLLDLPLRLLVLLLGRLLPLLRSTATTGTLLLEASGKTSGKRTCPHHAHHGQDQSLGAYTGMHRLIGRDVWPTSLSPHLLAPNHLSCPLPPFFFYAKAPLRQQA